MRTSFVMAIGVALTLVSSSISRAADVLDAWNARAVAAAETVAGRTQAVGFVEVAIVQAAVYDALNAIDGGRFQPYGSNPDTNPAASMDAAAAQAAHDVLIWLYPAQAADLDAALDASLAAIPEGAAKTDGIAAGVAAAAAMITLRTDDGRDAPIDYTPGSGPGVWQPTPPAFLAAQTPWLAFVRPFTMKRPSQFRSGPPPSLSSDEWSDALAEVRLRGALVGSNRTPDETEQALFWTDNAPLQYNRYFRRLATDQQLGPADKARLYAEVNMAAADASIACWDSKYTYSFWRPVTAIHAESGDDNRNAITDPIWLPLATTPNHPEYPSAHACISSSIVETLASFFGADDIVSAIDSTATGTARQFDRFGDMYLYVHEARILGGLHYRFSMNAGRRLGRHVAHRLVRHYFRPSDE